MAEPSAKASASIERALTDTSESEGRILALAPCLFLYYVPATAMQLQIDPAAKLPVYRQIVDQTHFAINTGSLSPGERLPSLRKLATEHAIAVNTVVKAFKTLEKRGLLVAGARSGYRVSTARKRPADAAEASRYAARGVSASKTEVHSAIAGLDPGLFPGAFCKVTEDYLTGDPDLCNVTHADGSGTKSAVAYLHYRETGDASVFRDVAQDSIVMNLDDLSCIGVTGRILLSSTINRNAHRIGPDVLAALIEGTSQFLETLRQHGVDVHEGGGETADVGDLTPTVLVDSCMTAVVDKAKLVTGEKIKPGLVIVGLASAGRATYEGRDNSGIGSNGLTSARHDLLSSYYRKKYPETFDAQTQRELVYSGPHRLESRLPGSRMTVLEALSSPTRTYAPIIAQLLSRHRKRVRGIVHCSGGGQTKCLRFGRGVHFVKDALMKPPAIFRAIRRASQTPWKEMYQVYNMGHRMEIYCSEQDAPKIMATASEFGVEAACIGHTEKSDSGNNQLTLHHGARRLRYAVG